MKRIPAVLAAVALAAGLASPAFASSMWTDPGTQWNAHSPFTVKMVDHTTGTWPARVAKAASDWSLASVVDVQLVTGSAKVTINDQYFGSGYPCGATIIYKTGQGTIKNAIINLNDSCLDSQTETFRQIIICLEMGHALGLGDYRTDTSATPSCMAPQNWGPSPNQDDYDQLSAEY
jgi:hypothetical protein